MVVFWWNRKQGQELGRLYDVGLRKCICIQQFITWFEMYFYDDINGIRGLSWLGSWRLQCLQAGHICCHWLDSGVPCPCGLMVVKNFSTINLASQDIAWVESTIKPTIKKHLRWHKWTYVHEVWSVKCNNDKCSIVIMKSINMIMLCL